MSVHFTSEKQDWATPPAMIQWLYDEGVIDTLEFDVAASEHNAKAPEFFTIEDDALTQDWPCGTLWCNPPFGKELPKFIRKAVDEVFLAEEEMRVWFFVPARLDTAWFHDLVWPNADILYFIRGRINFLEHGTDKRANAPFPNMLFSISNAKIGNWFSVGPTVKTLEPSAAARGR